MAVNGRLLPNTAPLVTDTAGRPLSHWPFGRYVVAPGTVWVASSYSSRSFDSRYFGPVEASSGARARSSAPDGSLNGCGLDVCCDV